MVMEISLSWFSDHCHFPQMKTTLNNFTEIIDARARHYHRFVRRRYGVSLGGGKEGWIDVFQRNI